MHLTLEYKFLEIVNNLIDSATEQMLWEMKKPDTVFLSAPIFVWEYLFKEEENYLFLQKQDFKLGKTSYRGIKLLPGTEMSITLFHKDYQLYLQDWMKKEYKLTSERKFIAA